MIQRLPMFHNGPATTWQYHLVYEIFKRDFELFKYDFNDPSNKMPIGEIDLDEVHAKLGD